MRLWWDSVGLPFPAANGECGTGEDDTAGLGEQGRAQGVRDKSDPIDHVKKLLEGHGVTEADLKTLEQDIRKIVNEAADFAENSPEPDPAELYTDVLVEEY